MEWGSIFDSINNTVSSVAGTATNLINAKAQLEAAKAKNSPAPQPVTNSAAVSWKPEPAQNKTALMVGGGLLLALLVYRLAK